MNYSEWEKTVPETIKQDSVWRIAAYRYALFLYREESPAYVAGSERAVSPDLLEDVPMPD
jgi:hypothetical protein